MRISDFVNLDEYTWFGKFILFPLQLLFGLFAVVILCVSMLIEEGLAKVFYTTS